jgi:hypothetical protein
VQVTAWGMVALEIRLHKMRLVLRDLARDPAPVASAVIARIRRAPSEADAAGPDAGVLAELRMQIHAWVSARSGIHAPHDPAIIPADPDLAVRLRAAWTLETAIDDLAGHHLHVAGHAAGLFAALRHDLGDDRAHDTAVRQAAAAFPASNPPAHDPAAPTRLAAPTVPDQPPAASDARSWPIRIRSAGGGPASSAVPGLAAAVPDAAAARAARAAHGSGGRHFPARRPGLNR